MKKYFINKYYDFIFWLEDKVADIETVINNHRKKIDEKWEKYLS